MLTPVMTWFWSRSFFVLTSERSRSRRSGIVNAPTAVRSLLTSFQPQFS